MENILKDCITAPDAIKNSFEFSNLTAHNLNGCVFEFCSATVTENIQCTSRVSAKNGIKKLH